MKVLFITNKFPPLVDGVGDYTYNLAHEFAKHGHEVTVVCKDHDGIHTTYDDIEVLPIVKAWNKQSIQPVINVIKKRQIEVVSLQYVPHGFHPKGLPFALISIVRAIKKQNIRLFTFCHEVCTSPEKGKIKFTLISYLMQYITRQILNQSDCVATSIGYYSQRIEQLTGRKNTLLIPIPSNIPLCRLSTNDIETLKRKIAPNHEFIVGFIGKRDSDECINAICSLIAEGEKVKMLSIGKTNRLNRDLKDYVYKTGVLDIKDLSAYIEVSDCIVLPENKLSGCSFKSGSLAASMRAGKVVITTKGFMTDNSLIDGENIIFTNGEFDKYRKSIQCLIYSQIDRKFIGGNAKTLTLRMTWTNTYKKYMECLRYE